MPDDRIRQLTKTLEKRALEVFGAPDKASAWLRTPLKCFAGRTPRGHVVATRDLASVEDLLTQIEQGG